MTIDIAKFIQNTLIKQAKIQHLNVRIKAVKTSSIPKDVKSIITDKYGDKYLLDASYVAFFWGGIDKNVIKRMFNVTDKALGQSANTLTDKDFKKIDIVLNNTNDEMVDVQVDDVEDNSDDYDDAEDSKESIDVDVDQDDELEDDNIDDSKENTLDEDDNETEQLPTSYFFLKITTK